MRLRSLLVGSLNVSVSVSLVQDVPQLDVSISAHGAQAQVFVVYVSQHTHCLVIRKLQACRVDREARHQNPLSVHVRFSPLRSQR